MNNLFSAGLLTISVIALNGCKESVDLKSGTYSNNDTPATTQATSHAPTNIVTTPPVVVVKVDATDTKTGNTDSSDTDADSAEDTSSDTDAGSGDTSTDTGTESTEDTTTDTGTDATEDTATDTGTDSTEDTSTDTGTDSDEDVDSGEDTTTDSDATDDTEAVASFCEVPTNSISSFTRVQLHYGLLSDAPFVNGELGGLDSLTVTEDASKGAKVLKLDSTTKLQPNQLITYIGINGENRVAKIGKVSPRQVTITSGAGLETKILAGSKISNFYFDPTHPNVNGYRAVADFGFRSAYQILKPAQTHVLLGDSWFDTTDDSGASEFNKQLALRLPNSTIFNAGIGGSTLCDLINRFDTDVSPRAPKYVWINSGINDYYREVSAQDFKARMQYLIYKVQEIGAEAIVFDSAPASGNSLGGADLTKVSIDYAIAVLNLFNESQPVD